jgi:hypothetical protein
MSFDHFILGLIFMITLLIFAFSMRRDCRWLALFIALLMTGLTAGIERFISDEAMARLLIQISILVMLGLSIPARYWFGSKNARGIVYRQHHIKATRYLPW